MIYTLIAYVDQIVRRSESRLSGHTRRANRQGMLSRHTSVSQICNRAIARGDQAREGAEG